MVECDFCGKEVSKKSDFLAKPSIFYLYPKLFYTGYHKKCFDESKRTYHGPINFYKDEKISAGVYIYPFIVLISILIIFVYAYPIKRVFISIILGLLIFINIVTLIKLKKDLGSFKK